MEPLLREPYQEEDQRKTNKCLNCLNYILKRVGAPVLVFLFMLVFGFALGLGLPITNKDPAPYDHISAVIGWIYFFAWSISFYPQVYTNWKRKKVTGLSFDFECYNLLGFGCYALFNFAFYYSASLQTSYEEHHDGNSNKVAVNDVFFAIHAVVLTMIHLFQILIYDRGTQTVSKFCITFCSLAVGLSIVYAALIAFDVASSTQFFTWYYFIYWSSYIKLAVTVVKYVPQVYLNYTRSSTVGWNIWNVLLDFTGGSLSIVQLLMDSTSTHDWSGVGGDPVKFALGFASMFFDLIFLTQHFILFPSREEEHQEDHHTRVATNNSSSNTSCYNAI